MRAAAADERLVALAQDGADARLEEHRALRGPRAVLDLADVEGLSTEQAAQVLGIGERALKSRVHRGRMALRAELDGYFESG